MFDWVWEVLWQFQRAIFVLIDWLDTAWRYLAGVKTLNDPATGNEANGITLLEGFFNSRGINTIFFFFLFVGLLVLVIAVIIAFIKNHLNNRDSAMSMKKTLGKSASAVLFMIGVPVAVYLGIILVGALFQGLARLLEDVLSISNTGEQQQSIARIFFEFCLPENSQNSYTLSKVNFDKSAAVMAEYTSLKDFNWFVGLGVGAILVFIIGFATINLVERIINIIILYVVSPLPIASMALDDGNRLSIWKDQILSKLLGAGGIILSMSIYQIFIRYITSVFNPALATSDTQKVVFNVIKLISLIGGALVAAKGGMTVAQLIGHNAGISEGMQQGASRGLMYGGMQLGRMAFGGIGAVLRGTARGRMAGASSAGSGLMGGGASGGGLSAAMSAVGGSGGASYGGGSGERFALNKGIVGNTKAMYNNVMNKRAGVSSTSERQQLRQEARGAFSASDPRSIAKGDTFAQKREAYAEKYLSKQAARSGAEGAVVGAALGTMASRGNFSNPLKPTGAQQAHAPQSSGSAQSQISSTPSPVSAIQGNADFSQAFAAPDVNTSTVAAPPQDGMADSGVRDAVGSRLPVTDSPMSASSEGRETVAPSLAPLPMNANAPSESADFSAPKPQATEGNPETKERASTPTAERAPAANTTTPVVSANAPSGEANFSTPAPQPIQAPAASAATPAVKAKAPKRDANFSKPASQPVQAPAANVATPAVNANMPAREANFSVPVSQPVQAPATIVQQNITTPQPIQEPKSVIQQVIDDTSSHILRRPPLRKLPTGRGTVGTRLQSNDRKDEKDGKGDEDK